MMKNLILIFSIILILTSINVISEENETNQTEFIINSENTTNQTIIPPENNLPEIELIDFFPKESKVGDVQLNIQIQNNKNEAINNVFALVTGKGFSTYNVKPISSLASGEKDYIFVNGNFKESGDIELTIKINDKEFTQDVEVLKEDIPNNTVEDNKESILTNLSIELTKLKENYTSLESAISEKKDDKYDVSKITLDDFKKYIRNSETSIILKEVEQTKANLKLADEEYNDLKNKLENVKKVSFISKIKDNAVLLTTLATALVMIFTLYEIFKKKSQYIITKIKIKRPKDGNEGQQPL